MGWGGLYWRLGLRLMQEYESKRNKGSESDVILCLKKNGIRGINQENLEIWLNWRAIQID